MDPTLENAGWGWRDFTPDVLEPVPDFFIGAWDSLPSVDALALPELPASIEITNPAEAPLEVLRAAIVELGDLAKLPAGAVSDLLEEAGDSRNALVGLFTDLMGEVGKSREGVLELLKRALDRGADIGENIVWAVILANVTFGMLVVLGLGAAAYLYLGGGKLEVLSSLGKMLEGK